MPKPVKRGKPSPSSKKSKRAPKSVEEYLLSVPSSARSAFIQLRKAIQSAVPREAVETISYRIPAFKNDGMLVWFAAFSNHCSLFPTAAVIEAFKDELKGFTTSKGTIHFPVDKPIPAALVRKLVKARAAEKRRKEAS